MKMKLCAACKKNEFEVIPGARYPRKYCKECSEKRKKLWDNQWKIKVEDCDDQVVQCSLGLSKNPLMFA